MFCWWVAVSFLLWGSLVPMILRNFAELIMKEIIMEKVLSGIRPTGHLHLGNYFGAVKSFVKMQNEYDCYFFIADWHSLTTCPSPENIRQSVRTILAEYLACGLEPDKATLYVQSDVRETLEI